MSSVIKLLSNNKLLSINERMRRKIAQEDRGERQNPALGINKKNLQSINR